MANDDLLLNFTVDDGRTIGPVTKMYKGRWKEKALSKKWDKIKAYRTLNAKASSTASHEIPPQKPPHNDKVRVATNGPPTERRHLKRKRATVVAFSSNAMPVMSRNSQSSSLFTNNPEITMTSPKREHVNPAPPTNAPLLTSSGFSALGISSVISAHLKKSFDISNPTEIQRLTIPHLLNSSKDTFIRAETGSGKTLAFLLPILHSLLSLASEHRRFDRTSGLFALILSPTRELAKQTENVLNTLTSGTWIVPGWLLGGERKKSEKARLRKGVNILVATPGRLADHLETTTAFDTSSMRWMVLDEGDRLVDMGFLETVGKIIRIIEGRVQHRFIKMRKEGGVDAKLPSRLVKILCSATLRGEEGLGALETIVDPVFLKAEIESGDTEGDDRVLAPGQLTQKAIVLPPKLRFVTLSAVLGTFTKYPPPAKMIIFLSCSTSVDYHHQLLSSFDFDLQLFQIHGQLEQPVRTATLKQFVEIKNRAVLLATDVASRGLDLPSVDVIVQYDPPSTQDDYIHRVGRTARAGRKGEGIIFLLPSEEGYINELTCHGSNVERITYQFFLQNAFGEDWQNEATSRQLAAEKWILQDEDVSSSLNIKLM